MNEMRSTVGDGFYSLARHGSKRRDSRIHHGDDPSSSDFGYSSFSRQWLELLSLLSRQHSFLFVRVDIVE